MTFALCEVRLDSSRWTLLSTSSDWRRLSELGRVMNRNEPSASCVIYRTVDYATAVQRIRGR